ncbi:MAG: hypothetical protein HKO59_09450 [Phycisphaerales bacterium]|nr:hypothetical protein [Phycisphaerae bacterium]NNF43310.1 hypothetical protein [Phycisphaerales bacterium]NNM26194.1 hypothetical protein [Phycisphaerales bacterium]
MDREPMDEKLIEFVDHARDKGLDHATIRQLLLSAGWREKDVAEVICRRDLELPIPPPTRVASPPVPRGRRSSSPWPRRAREAFLHLLTFGALFTWATNLIVLFFTYINSALPDPAWRLSQSFKDQIVSATRAQLAAVIVAFPVFLVLWHFLLREVRHDREKAKGAIRRWLIYLTLFIGAIALSGDIITLIYFMLEGQLTLRLVLKAAVLFLIAGSLVLYLGMTLRSETDPMR